MHLRELSWSEPTWLFRMRRFIGLDRAVLFTVLARAWSTIAGGMTVLLIARFLTPVKQGYYYTFSSLVALQIVFELGFSYVILQLAAHERAHLAILPNGQIEGEPAAHARLASVLQKAVRWYAVAALLMASTLLVVGERFFANHSHPGAQESWRGPWIFIVFCAAAAFQIDPVFSFLDGCGKVAQVARIRLVQATCGSVLAWGALIFHYGLYSPGMMIAGKVLAGLYFVWKYRSLLVHLLCYRVGSHAIDWWREVWPFQWRLAVTWASSYFIFQLFNPVLFAYQGPIEAGRMGMSLSIANALSAVALAWMSTKSSPFGAMIAKREYARLDRLFFSTMWQSTGILAAGIVATLGALSILLPRMPRAAGRILPFSVFALLLLTMLLNHVVVCEAYYLRAHKREVFLYCWVFLAIASVASTIWLGKTRGAAGVTVGYFIIGGVSRIVIGTSVFRKKRREWHRQSELSPQEEITA